MPLTISTASGKPGETFTIRSEGWQPGSPVSVTFHSDPVALGTLTADAAGVITGTFEIPAVAAGAHSVVLAGTSAAGVATSTSIAISVVDAVVAQDPDDDDDDDDSFAEVEGNQVLPVTGTEALRLAGVATILVAAGTVVLVTRRRRES